MLLLLRLGMLPAESAAPLKLLERGVSKEALAGLVHVFGCVSQVDFGVVCACSQTAQAAPALLHNSQSWLCLSRISCSRPGSPAAVLPQILLEFPCELVSAVVAGRLSAGGKSFTPFLQGYLLRLTVAGVLTAVVCPRLPSGLLDGWHLQLLRALTCSAH